MPKPAIAFLTTLSLVALPFNTIAIDVPPLTVCGSTMGQIVGAQIMEVLQATLGGYSFDVACQAHDACYGDCKTTKADCDKKLLTDAEGVCESARLRNFCISDAQGAFLLVSKMGEVPFREARANCSATALQNYPDAGTGGGGGVGVASTVGISKQGGRDAASASAVKVGSVTQGQLEVPQDQHYFRFTPQHRANYVVYTRGPTQTTGELYDERFNPLANNSFGGGGQNFRISQQLEPGRTYYVLVRGQPGPYSLHVDGPESLYSATELKMGSSTVPQCRSTEITNLARAALKDKAAGITFGYLCQPYIQTGLGLHAHAGIDLKAAERTPVYAIASGDVVAVDRQSLGKLMIKLPDGKRLIYLHLSRIDVHEGQSVSIGDPLGLSGSKGTDSPHLHIEVRTNYSGKFALGGDSCGGECSAAQVGDKTVDPAAVVSR